MVFSFGGYRYEIEWRMFLGIDCDRLFVWKVNEVLGELKIWIVRLVLFLGQFVCGVLEMFDFDVEIRNMEGFDLDEEFEILVLLSVYKFN